MGLVEKERKWYNDGLVKAQALVRLGGIELLDAEIEQRKVNNAPAGVSSFEIKDAAREYSKKELEIVATALAYTVSFDMGLPPSIAVDFLKKYNSRTDELRRSEDKLNELKQKLNDDSGMVEWLIKFNKNKI